VKNITEWRKIMKKILLIGFFVIGSFSAFARSSGEQSGWKPNCTSKRLMGKNFYGLPIYHSAIDYKARSLEECLGAHGFNTEFNNIPKLKVEYTSPGGKNYKIIIEEI
jgi:hypothetical protein